MSRKPVPPLYGPSPLLGLGVEEGEDGQYSSVAVRVGFDAELRHEAGDVSLDRSLRQEQSPCDGGVGVTLSHQGEYLAFACGQRVQGFVGAVHADQPGHDFGVESGTPGRDSLEGVEEVVDVENPILQ